MAIAGLGLTFLFLKITDNYIDNEGLMVIDRPINQLVTTIRQPWLNQVMRFITLTANWQIIVWATVLATTLLAMAKKERYMMAIILSVSVGLLFTEGMKTIVSRPRPPIENALILQGGYAYPSGHSYFAMVFYGLITYFWVRHFRDWRIKIIIGMLGVGFGVMIGISRIYLGVHWATDVLAGMTASGAWLAVIISYIEYRNKFFAKDYKKFNRKLVWRGFWIFTLLWLSGVGWLFWAQK